MRLSQHVLLLETAGNIPHTLSVSHNQDCLSTLEALSVPVILAYGNCVHLALHLPQLLPPCREQSHACGHSLLVDTQARSKSGTYFKPRSSVPIHDLAEQWTRQDVRPQSSETRSSHERLGASKHQEEMLVAWGGQGKRMHRHNMLCEKHCVMPVHTSVPGAKTAVGSARKPRPRSKLAHNPSPLGFGPARVCVLISIHGKQQLFDIMDRPVHAAQWPKTSPTASAQRDSSSALPPLAPPSQHACPANEAAVRLPTPSTHPGTSSSYVSPAWQRSRAQGSWTDLGSAGGSPPHGQQHTRHASSLQPRLSPQTRLAVPEASVAALGRIPASWLQHSWAWRSS